MNNNMQSGYQGYPPAPMGPPMGQPMYNAPPQNQMMMMGGGGGFQNPN